jgi:3-methyladenine DNA glycosylase AlkD
MPVALSSNQKNLSLLSKRRDIDNCSACLMQIHLPEELKCFVQFFVAYYTGFVVGTSLRDGEETMRPDPLVVPAVTLLSSLADPKRAAGMKAYMRGQFEFLGIPTPARRAATRQLLRQPFSAVPLLGTARALWALPQREYQYVALGLLIRHWKALSLQHIDALLDLAGARSWWDSVDGLAGVAGDVVRLARRVDPNAQRAMDAALTDDDMWIRRIAMLHQLGWRAETDESRLFGYALRLASETDFFIRKAIGWALRDYARHDPDAVRAFLGGSGQRLSTLSLREAAKHLGNGTPDR